VVAVTAPGLVHRDDDRVIDVFGLGVEVGMVQRQVLFQLGSVRELEGALGTLQHVHVSSIAP